MRTRIRAILTLCMMPCFICGSDVEHTAPQFQDELFDIETFFDDVTKDDVCFTGSPSIPDNIDIETVLPQLAIFIEEEPVSFARTQTIARLIAKGLYKRAHPFMERNVLDLPSISYVTPHTTPGCATLSAHSFYNHTSEVKLGLGERLGSITNLDTPECVAALKVAEEFASDSLPDLLGAIGPDKLNLTREQLEQTQNTLMRAPQLDIPQTVPLFADILLQERKAGVMFTYALTQEDWFFAFQVPFLYQEQNFFATDRLINRLSKTPLIQRLSESSDDDTQTESFFKQHLIADRIGFGDMRLTWLHRINPTETLPIWAGLELTLPSAFDVSEGLVGGDFPEVPRQPRGEVQRLINLASSSGSSRALNETLTTLTEALDRLTRVFADRPLGQEHFGIAPIVTWQFDGTACTVTGRARLEYMTPRSLPRFFLEPVPFEQLTNRDYTETDDAIENFNFLEDALVRTLFPRPLTVSIDPGLSPYIAMSLGQSFDSWRWHTGWDFWYRQRERITLPEGVGTQRAFDVSASERPRAYQCKWFANVGTDVATNHYLWHLGLAFDIAFASDNIGHDGTISLHVSTAW